MKRYAYLDSLRGIAILMVLVAHTSLFGSNQYPSWFLNLTSVHLGPRGVQLFFLVSAFTLCLSFSKRLKKESHVLRNFYIRRFFRIAPLFYTAILYFLWQQLYWQGNPNHFSLLNIFSVATFTNGLFPAWINSIVFGGWSIAVEAMFYLFFPLLFKLLKSIPIALFSTVIALVVMQLLRLFLLGLPFAADSDVQTYLFQFFPSQLPIFLIGMSVFILMEKNQYSNHDKKCITATGVVVFLLFAAQIFFHLKIIAGHYIYALLFSGVLYFLSRYPIALLVNPVTTYLGKISFSIYVSHFAVLFWLNEFGLSDLYYANPFINYGMRLVVLVSLSTTIASVLFYIVEQNGQALGKMLVKRNEAVTSNWWKEYSLAWVSLR
jgi:peptidoglycan/LPS O-acetylase OafA/YrhL